MRSAAQTVRDLLKASLASAPIERQADLAAIVESLDEVIAERRVSRGEPPQPSVPGCLAQPDLSAWLC